MEFDFVFEYKPGKANQDALTWKAEVAALSKPEGILLDVIEEGLKHDQEALASIKAIDLGRTKVFQVEDSLLLFKRDKRLYVPDWFNLTRSLVRECHDKKWAGHPGTKCTRALLEKAYYWPQMHGDIESYVRACPVCPRNKIEQSLP